MKRSRALVRIGAASKRPTIKDVADAAGVSVTTVSNVLNKRTGAMSPDTLDRIQHVIASLNYRPSGVARGLVQRRTATIGVVLAEIDTPLFLQALSTIETASRMAGYNVFIVSARGMRDEEEAVNLLLEKETDGVVFLSISVRTHDAHFLPLQTAGVPVVLINRATDSDYGFDRVDWDNAGGIDAAVVHLAQLGHRRIALLSGPSERRSTAERLSGYRRALEKCGLVYDDDYIGLADYNAPDVTWQEAVARLLALAVPPTALIAGADSVAAVAMRTAQRAGQRVPHDLAVVGIDDQPFGAYLNPPLTTVRLPVPEAGAQAIHMLLDRLAERTSGRKHVMLPCTLIVRDSSGGRQT